MTFYSYNPTFVRWGEPGEFHLGDYSRTAPGLIEQLFKLPGMEGQSLDYSTIKGHLEKYEDPAIVADLDLALEMLTEVGQLIAED